MSIFMFDGYWDRCCLEYSGWGVFVGILSDLCILAQFLILCCDRGLCKFHFEMFFDYR